MNPSRRLKFRFVWIPDNGILLVAGHLLSAF